MNKVKTYTVAGHTFCFELEESDLIWKRLAHSFSPFEEVKECKHPLFTLTVCEQLEDRECAEPLFINPDLNPPGGRINVYQTREGCLFEMFPYAKEVDQSFLLIADNGKSNKLLLQGNELERSTTANTALMLCYLLNTIRMGTLLIHASAILKDGACYLFLGRSGTGKSTHSKLWIEHIQDAELLNDDHPIIRILPDGEVQTYGSPWSGKTACYRNIHAPLGGVVRIKQAPHNKIEQLSPIKSYASLTTSCCWGFNWDKDLMSEKDRTLQEIIKKIPCYTLECLPNKEAAILCVENVLKSETCNR